ncbi:MAG: O-antigen ligase family protein [Desulfobacterales bacterium]|nr:O-antigen ligase family protein [Desulfobacterales bacterium]
MRPHILLVFFIVFALLAGFLISQYPPHNVIIMALVAAIFVVSFINVEWGLYILIFSMLLSPELNVAETAGGSLQRGVTLRFEDFLLVLIGFSWFARTAINKELGLFLKTPLNKPIFIYISACLVSTGFGILAGRVDAITGPLFVLKYVEYFIVYFMVVNHLKSSNQVKRFVFCLLLTCFITSVIGILQIPSGERVSAPFEGEIGEPNTFGGYLLFLGSMAAGLLLKSESARSKQLYLFLIIAIIPAFLFTQSRASYLGLIATCFAFAMLSRHRIIIAGFLTLALISSPLFLPQEVKDRILYTFTQPGESGQIQIGDIHLDTSTSARIASLQKLLSDWPKKPVIGYGVTGYDFLDAQYPRVLIETGLLGLLAFMYLLFSVLRMAIDCHKVVKTPFFKGLAIGFLAGYVGILIHAMGANTFIIVRIMEPFWFFAGIIAVLPSLERQHLQQDQEQESPAPRLAAVR